MAHPDPNPPLLRVPTRWGQLALGLLLVFFVAWDLRAILADNQLTVNDTTVEDAILLEEAVREYGGLRGVVEWLGITRKGPLAGPVVLLLDLFVGDLLVAARLLGVLAHAALLWLVCGLVRRLTGGWAEALLAVVVCGAFPGIYGLCRLEYHDALIAVATVLTLWLMTREIGRPWAPLTLGLTVGLGLLSKLPFALYIALPAVLYLHRHARSRRDALRLGLALAVAVAAVGWWLFPTWRLFLFYARRSTTQLSDARSWLDKLAGYAVDIPGTGAFVGAGLAGAWVAWRSRVAPPFALALLVSCIVGAVAALVAVFDTWARYLLPLFAPAGILVTLGLAGLARWAEPRCGRRAVGAGMLVLALGLVAQFCVHNIRGVWFPGNERFSGVGMAVPDRRPYPAFPAMAHVLRRRGWRVVEVPRLYPGFIVKLWARRGYALPTVPANEVPSLLRGGEPVYLVHMNLHGDPLEQVSRALAEAAQAEPLYRPLANGKRSVVWRLADPVGWTFVVVRVQR